MASWPARLQRSMEWLPGQAIHNHLRCSARTRTKASTLLSKRGAAGTLSWLCCVSESWHAHYTCDLSRIHRLYYHRSSVSAISQRHLYSRWLRLRERLAMILNFFWRTGSSHESLGRNLQQIVSWCLFPSWKLWQELAQTKRRTRKLSDTKEHLPRNASCVLPSTHTTHQISREALRSMLAGSCKETYMTRGQALQVCRGCERFERQAPLVFQQWMLHEHVCDNLATNQHRAVTLLPLFLWLKPQSSVVQLGWCSESSQEPAGRSWKRFLR